MTLVITKEQEAFMNRLDEVAIAYEYEAHRLIPTKQLVSSLRQHYNIGDDERFREYVNDVFDSFEVEKNIPSEKIAEVIQRARELAPMLYS